MIVAGDLEASAALGMIVIILGLMASARPISHDRGEHNGHLAGMRAEEFQHVPHVGPARQAGPRDADYDEEE
jgi:hypothetical protein